MAKLADAPDLGSGEETHAGSIPVTPTNPFVGIWRFLIWLLLWQWDCKFCWFCSGCKSHHLLRFYHSRDETYKPTAPTTSLVNGTKGISGGVVYLRNHSTVGVNLFIFYNHTLP